MCFEKPSAVESDLTSNFPKQPERLSALLTSFDVSQHFRYGVWGQISRQQF